MPILTWFALACTGLDDPPNVTTSPEQTEIPPEDCTPSTWFRDADGDGWGTDTETQFVCDPGFGWVAEPGDCDDQDSTVFPTAPDVCDGIDQDCDEAIDEDATWETWYNDADGDGFGDDATGTLACVAPAGAVAVGGDCDDARDDIHPGAPEPDCTDPTDYDCDLVTAYADLDTDGWASCVDCDDTNADVRPDADERCNGIDDDCNLAIDEPTAVDALTWYADGDGDGYGDPNQQEQACSAPPGTVADASDCDDGRGDVNPDGTEQCDRIDNDCDGDVDEADAIDAPIWFRDADGDGYGNGFAQQEACAAPAGWVADATDCNDNDGDIHPTATETCDAVDQDCDMVLNEADAIDAPTWYADADRDGYGNPDVAETICLAPPGFVSTALDCDDTNGAVNPDELEVCGPEDDDCDSLVDVNAIDATTWYLDSDHDGFGLTSTTSRSCTAPADHAAVSGDCDDADSTIRPDALEVCDGVDQDCDTVVDDGVLNTYYLDADLDGEGGAAAMETCDPFPPVGTTLDGTDCDDSDPYVHTGARELCDGQKNDCADVVWTSADESGKVSHVSDDGAWLDVTGLWALGNEGDPIELTTPTDGTLHVCPGAHFVALTVPSGADLTIAGRWPAVGDATLDCDFEGRNVTLADDTVRLLLVDLELVGGSVPDDGGALYNPGAEVTIERSVLDGNADGHGGAIWSEGGSLSIIDSELEGDSESNGGTIYAWNSDVTLEGSTADGTADISGGGVFWGSDDDATLSIVDTTLSGVAEDSDGGALYIDASGTGAIAVTDVLFTLAAAGDGGGLYLGGIGTGPVVVSDSAFTAVAAGSSGGAIYYTTLAPTTLTNLDISECGANAGAGIAFETSGSLFDSTIRDNGSIFNGGSIDHGGGISVDGGSTVTLDGVTVEENIVSDHGGGIWVDAGSSLTCSGCTIHNNYVLLGSHCLDDEDCSGHGIYTEGAVTLLGSVVSANGTDILASIKAAGGGVRVSDSGSLVLDEFTEITGNETSKGGGISVNGGDLGPATVTIRGGASVWGNVATDGGGLYLHDAAEVFCEDDGDGAAIAGNVGGGVYIFNSPEDIAIEGSLCDMGATGTADDNTTNLGVGAADVHVDSLNLWMDFADDATFSCTEDGC